MEKILLINDCRFESIVIKDTLEGLGYEVKITNEFGAVKFLKEYCPSIVISNLIMKKTTGDKLIKKLKDSNPDVKFFLSSCNDIRLEDYNNMGVHGVIHTPINEKILRELLKKENAF